MSDGMWRQRDDRKWGGVLPSVCEFPNRACQDFFSEAILLVMFDAQ